METEGSSPHSQVPMSETFCLKISLQDTFLRWVVSTPPNPQAGGSHLVGCPRLLRQYTRGWPPHWRPFLHPQPVDAPHRVYTDPDKHGYLSVSHRQTVNMAKVRIITVILSVTKSRLVVAFHHLVHTRQAGKWRVCTFSIIRYLDWRCARHVVSVS